MRAKWDDYIQVWIEDNKVYNGPNADFPPEKGVRCELGISWDKNLNIDVTQHFKKSGYVNTKIRVSVSGWGEGYAYVIVKLKPQYRLIETVTDLCGDPGEDCVLQKEIVDGVVAYDNFNPTGNIALPSSKTVSGEVFGETVTRDWWLKQKTYLCQSPESFDFTDAKVRSDTIAASTLGNMQGQRSLSYQDKTKQDDGIWNTESLVLTIPDINPGAGCQFVCKTKKLTQNTQAGMTGTAALYKTTDSAFDIMYHTCEDNSICPAGSGEQILKDCACINEFKDAAVMMLALKEAGKNTKCIGSYDAANQSCTGEFKIFKGKASDCLPRGSKTGWMFDCCDASEDNFLGIIQKHCSEQCQETVQAMAAGRAHQIGEYCQKETFWGDCIQRARRFCIFNSKLGRIIHEQGRAQLKRFASGWGSVDHPDCDGFTPEQFAMLDFSQIDLTEFISDIVPKTDNLLEKAKGRFEQFIDATR